MGEEGYWLVLVDRESGHAATVLVPEANDAWQRSIDEATPEVFTTVVRRRIQGKQERHSC